MAPKIRRRRRWWCDGTFQRWAQMKWEIDYIEHVQKVYESISIYCVQITI